MYVYMLSYYLKKNCFNLYNTDKNESFLINTAYK